MPIWSAPVRIYRQILRKILGLPPASPVDPNALIYKAACITATDNIKGDYLEFGVFQGNTFAYNYNAIKLAFDTRSAVTPHGVRPEESAQIRQTFQEMRFFAFDSFEGLPENAGPDVGSFEFDKGKYASSKDLFLKNATSVVPPEKIQIVQGWFDKTLTPQTIQKHGLKSASIIWIDCDLYTSTKSVLDFIPPLLTDGTIIIFDDWFSFRGSPFKGEQLAWYEFVQQHPDWVFHPYQTEGTWRMSFLCNKRIDPHAKA